MASFKHIFTSASLQVLLYKFKSVAGFEESAPDRRKAKWAAASTFEPKILAPVLELETADDDTDTDDFADIERHEMQQFFASSCNSIGDKNSRNLSVKPFFNSTLDQLLMIKWD